MNFTDDRNERFIHWLLDSFIRGSLGQEEEQNSILAVLKQIPEDVRRRRRRRFFLLALFFLKREFFLLVQQFSLVDQFGDSPLLSAVRAELPAQLISLLLSIPNVQVNVRDKKKRREAKARKGGREEKEKGG